MIFDGRLVISFGRLALVTEMAQEFSLAAAGDRCSPQPSVLIERDAFVAGALLSVVSVLSGGGRAQVGLAVVKAVVVDVIDNHIIGDSEHFAVHGEPVPFALFENRANRIEGRAAFYGVPIALGEPEIIVRIDDGVLALGQRYPAE